MDTVNSDSEQVLAEIEADLKRNLVSPIEDTPNLVDDCLTRLRAVPISVSPTRRIGILIDAASQYYWHGEQISRATEPLAMAVLLAERCGDETQLRKALNVQGTVRGAINDLAGALSSLTRALNLAERLNQPLLAAVAWLNIGIALINGTLLGEARFAFEKALNVLRRTTSSPLTEYIRGKALHGAALAACRLQDYTGAIHGFEEALQLLDKPEDRDQEQTRSLAGAMYVRLLLGANRMREASVQAEIASEMANRSGSERARVTADLTRALVDAYEGHSRRALEIVEANLPTAGSNSDTAYTILEAAISVMERLGRLDDASRLHRELMELIRRTRIANIARNAMAPSMQATAGAEKMSANLAAFVSLRRRTNVLLDRSAPGAKGNCGPHDRSISNAARYRHRTLSNGRRRSVVPEA